MVLREDDARMQTGYSISSLSWVAGEIKRILDVKRTETIEKRKRRNNMPP